MAKTVRHNKPSNKRTTKVKNKNERIVEGKEQVKCYNDTKFTKVCRTGQFSTYEGDFYTNKDHLARFAELGTSLKADKSLKKYKTNQEKYIQFLSKKFVLKEKDASTLKLMRDNFYGYCNNLWLKENEVKGGEQKYYVQHDDFRVKQEEAYYQLISYVKDYVKANPRDKKAIAIDNVYKSLTTDTSKKTRQRALAVIAEVDKFIEADDMYALLAHINKFETINWCAPISWVMLPDEKDVQTYISHLYPASLGLYDSDLYVDDNKLPPKDQQYKKEVRKRYMHYMEEVFKAILPANIASKMSANDIWQTEIELMTASNCDEVKKDDPDGYNVVKGSEMERLYGFDWPAFAKALGFKTVPPKLIVGSLNSIQCLTKLLKEKWKSPAWRTYWIFIQLKQMIRFEDTMRHVHYEFYNHFLEGQQVIMPKEIYPIFAMSMLFNTFLSEQYLAHHYNPLYVKYVRHLVDDLKKLFYQKLQRNTWLATSTKKAALKKLDKLEIFVASPGKLLDDPVLPYVADDPLLNIGLLLNWKHQKFLQLDGKQVIDIPEIDWQNFKLVGTQCYMVNAYYRPTSNSIYVPMAYIQKPFIDLEERGLEYNLVYIGYTLGHELSHALDDFGSKYDENGNLNNWWTAADNKKFQEKIDDVIKQYETFAKRDGVIFDARPGVGEDLADISGIALVEEYLTDNQIINDEDVKVKKMNLAKLYMNLAIGGRQIINKQAIKAQLKMNPHPMEKYRANCPLARLQIFRMIYGVKKGDGMWWSNTDTIW